MIVEENQLSLVHILAFICLGSAVLGVLCIIFSITLAFNKIIAVESRIATPGKQLDGIRSIWRGGVVGRWMRATHVFLFFVFRKIPRYGPKIGARMGDEIEPLSRNDKLWVILPVGIFFLLLAISFVSGAMMMALDQ